MEFFGSKNFYRSKLFAATAVLALFFSSGVPAAWGVENSSSDTQDIKDDIDKVENKLEKEQKAKSILEKDLGNIQNSIYLKQREINQVQSRVEETADIITRKENEVEMLVKEEEIKKYLLESLLREMYYSDSQPMISLILDRENISQTVENADHFLTLQDRIKSLIEDIQETKETIGKEKTDLEKTKSEHENLLEDKQDEKGDLLADRRDTQVEINKKQATIQELRDKLSELKSNLSRVLDKEYDAKDIEDAAAFAAKITGVRKDFLMGMLVVESDLGRYTGGCTYQQVEDGAIAAYKKGRLGKTAWATFQKRRDTFKSIAKELDLDYRKQKVSCNPKSYAGTGGAMGVPQFMPDTWMAYKSQIANATGHRPPSPWNLTDGVAAMAIKLAKVPGVTSKSKSAEKNASKIYLSGTVSSAYNWYAEKVQYWADNYERLLDK